MQPSEVFLFLPEQILAEPVGLGLGQLLLSRQGAFIFAVSGLDEVFEGRAEVVEDLFLARGDRELVPHEQNVVAVRRG